MRPGILSGPYRARRTKSRPRPCCGTPAVSGSAGQRRSARPRGQDAALARRGRLRRGCASGGRRAGSRTSHRGGRRRAAARAVCPSGAARAWWSHEVLRSWGVCRSGAYRRAGRRADQIRQRLSSTTVMDIASRQRQISALLPLSPTTWTVWHAVAAAPRPAGESAATSRPPSAIGPPTSLDDMGQEAPLQDEAGMGARREVRDRTRQGAVRFDADPVSGPKVAAWSASGQMPLAMRQKRTVRAAGRAGRGEVRVGATQGAVAGRPSRAARVDHPRSGGPTSVGSTEDRLVDLALSVRASAVGARRAGRSQPEVRGSRRRSRPVHRGR